MFEQLPDGRSNPGTGIGLAIVKRIVESRGGRIQLESQEGTGAVFTFTWPDKPLVPAPGCDAADPAI
jgi:signal transduction histidine kinase